MKDIMTPDVKIVRWPAESGKLEGFRMQGLPCLIVVARGARVPELAGAHEDWVRQPVEAWELKTRIASLHLKATSQSAPPVVDEDGILRYGGAVLPLTVSEGVVLRGLMQRRPGMASRAELAQRLLSADRSASQNALDLHIMRLRRKVVAVGAGHRDRAGAWVSPEDPGRAGPERLRIRADDAHSRMTTLVGGGTEVGREPRAGG